MKESFIIIDKNGSVHAHVKSTTSTLAKSTYVNGFVALESRTFAVTKNQFQSIKL